MPPTRFTLPITFLAFLALAAASCQTTPHVPAGVEGWAIDSGLLDDLPPLVHPAGAVRTGDGAVERFIVDELIFRPRSPQALRVFLAQYDGVVVHDGATGDLGPTEDRLVRVNLERADLSKLDAWLSENAEAPVVFSSERAARLMAILVDAAFNEGRRVTPNWLLELSDTDCVISTTEEHPDGAGFRDAFEFEWANDPAIGLTRAWQYWDLLELPRGQVTLAIIDTAFASNPDFPPVGQLLQFDASDLDSDALTPPSPDEVDWHGTSTASIAAARLDNRFGSAGTGGIAEPTLALIRAGRGMPSFYGFALSVRAAVHLGADVISVSMGMECGWWCSTFFFVSDEHALSSAVKEAIANDVIVIASAGNAEADLSSTYWIPCELEGVICVGAIDVATKNAKRAGNKRDWGSNYGPRVDLWAPGQVDVTPAPGENKIRGFGGTSAAAPYVAGIVTLMRSIDPGLDPARARAVLKLTAAPSPDPRVRPGFVNALSAVVKTAVDAGVAPHGDQHEPNGTRADAATLTGLDILATITPGDVDHYVLDLDDYAGPFEAEVRGLPAGGLGDLTLDLLGPFADQLPGETAAANGPVASLEVAGTLSPGPHVLKVEATEPETMNCYTLSHSWQPASIEPDDFDDGPRPPNDRITDATVIALTEVPGDPRFAMAVGPGVMQLGGKGMLTSATPLNFHDGADVDIFRIELDPTFTPTFVSECPPVLAPPLPAGYHEVSRLAVARLVVRATPIAVPQPGGWIVGQQIPLRFTVHDSSGAPLAATPAIRKTAWTVEIDCPLSLFPDGVLHVKIDADGRRSFYRFEARYQEPYVIARDPSAIPRPEPFFDFDFGDVEWKPPIDPGPLHRVFPSDPRLIEAWFAGRAPETLPPDHVRFTWPERRDFAVDIVATIPGARFDFTLLDSAGSRVASSWEAERDDDRGRTHRRIAVSDLEAGWYALEVRFAEGAQPYAVIPVR